MNLDEITKIIGSNDSPIALGGYDSDDFDVDCGIQNVIIFDGKDISDEIITHESKTLKISHGTLSETNPEHLIYYGNIKIIQDIQWEVKMLVSKVQEKKNMLFSTSAKNSLVESQLSLSKAKNALEHDDPFVSCWIKSGIISLIDSRTAICIPKQIPRNGFLLILAYLIAFILPLAPLFPKPPGTIIPLYSLSIFSHDIKSFNNTESIQVILTFTLL